jgi:hypothetical protein
MVTKERAHEQGKDKGNDDKLKGRRSRLSPPEVSGLTCNEASVDTILSDGEST